MNKLAKSSDNSAKKIAILIATPLLLGGVLAGATLWMSRATQSEPGALETSADEANSSSMVESSKDETNAQGGVASSGENNSGGQGSSSEINALPGGENEQQSAENANELEAHVRAFFDAPELDAVGNFISKPQPVGWNENCNFLPPEEKFADLREEVDAKVSVPLARFPSPEASSSGPSSSTKLSGSGTGAVQPRKRRILTVNQFYRDAARTRFFQLSLVRGDQKQDTFKLEVVESPDDTLRKETARLVLAPANGEASLSYEEALKQMQVVVEDVVKRGFVMGTRGVVLAPEVKNEGGDDFYTNVEVVGGKVTNYQRGQIHCQHFSASARCSCNVDFAPQE